MEAGIAHFFAEVKRGELGLPVLTDVHEDTPLAEVAAVVDVLQDAGLSVLRAPISSSGRRPRRAFRSTSRRASSSPPGKCRTSSTRRARPAILPNHGVRTRLQFRLQQSRFRYALIGGDARDRVPGGLRRHPLGATAGRPRQMLRAASANSCQCWRERPSPPAWPACSWRPIRKPEKALSDGPNAWPLIRVCSHYPMTLQGTRSSVVKSRPYEEALL